MSVFWLKSVIGEIKKMKMANHVSFDAIEKYLIENSYPPEIIGDKGGKVHFGRFLNFFVYLMDIWCTRI